MRTTVDIPFPLYRELKAKAAKEGISMREVILRGLESELRSSKQKKGRIKLPIVRSKNPGTLELTNEQIYEIVPFP